MPSWRLIYGVHVLRLPEKIPANTVVNWEPHEQESLQQDSDK